MIWRSGTGAVDAPKYLETTIPFNENEIQLSRKFGDVYDKLHSYKTDNIPGAQIMNACQQYANILEGKSEFYTLFKLFESCILTLPEINIKPILINSFKNFVNDTVVSKEQDIIRHLIYQPNDFDDFYKEKGGTSLVIGIIRNAYMSPDIQLWAQKAKEYIDDQNSSDVDKSVLQFILSDKYNTPDWKLNMLLNLYFKTTSIHTTELADYCKQFFSPNTAPESIDKLYELIITGDCPSLLKVIFPITHNDLISAHISDLVYCALNDSSFHFNHARADRNIAIARYAETLMPERSLADLVPVYVRGLPNGPQILSVLLSRWRFPIGVSTTAVVGKIPEFENEVFVEPEILTLLRAARGNNIEMSHILHEHFLNTPREFRSEAVKLAQPVIMSGCTINAEVVAALLDAAPADDEDLKKALVERVFDEIENTGEIAKLI